MPTHNRRNKTPNPIKTDATSDTNNSLKISLVNLLEVTSYLDMVLRNCAF